MFCQLNKIWSDYIRCNTNFFLKRVHREFSPASHIHFRQVFASVSVSLSPFLGTLNFAVPCLVPWKVFSITLRPDFLTSTDVAWDLCAFQQYLNPCISSEFQIFLGQVHIFFLPYFSRSANFCWLTWEGTILSPFFLNEHNMKV